MKIDAILMKKYQGLVKVFGLKNVKVQGRFFAKNTEVLQRVNHKIAAKSVKVQQRVNRITAKSSKVYIRVKAIFAIVLVSLLATCSPSPSYANKPFDLVAVSGNNCSQERKKLFKSVQHRTIADVFLCLPFINLPFMGELRLAIAFISLWWGGGGNKPFIRRIPPAVDLRFLTLPAALHLGKIIKTSLPVRKV